MRLSDKSVLKHIHDFFKKENLSLSVAESCTGGLVASMITDLPGASEFFDSGVVTYSNESKMDMVSVKRTIIEKEGAVSEETARGMAEGVRKRRKTAFALSVTGNLGPSALEDKGVGLIFLAVSSPAGTFSRAVRLSGSRTTIKRQAAIAGLRFLLEVVSS